MTPLEKELEQRLTQHKRKLKEATILLTDIREYFTGHWGGSIEDGGLYEKCDLPTECFKCLLDDFLNKSIDR